MVHNEMKLNSVFYSILTASGSGQEGNIVPVIVDIHFEKLFIKGKVRKYVLCIPQADLEIISH